MADYAIGAVAVVIAFGVWLRYSVGSVLLAYRLGKVAGRRQCSGPQGCRLDLPPGPS